MSSGSRGSKFHPMVNQPIPMQSMRSTTPLWIPFLCHCLFPWFTCSALFGGIHRGWDLQYHHGVGSTESILVCCSCCFCWSMSCFALGDTDLYTCWVCYIALLSILVVTFEFLSFLGLPLLLLFLFFHFLILVMVFFGNWNTSRKISNNLLRVIILVSYLIADSLPWFVLEIIRCFNFFSFPVIIIQREINSLL